jgi:hypothetical protein
MRCRVETVPQRLKPHCKCSGYGTAEAVPLSKTEYLNKLLVEFGRPLLKSNSPRKQREKSGNNILD